jgi:hypothetical protein
MTDHKQFFERAGRQAVVDKSYLYFTVEEMYQAFKQRLIEETTVCELPKDRVEITGEPIDVDCEIQEGKS